MGDPLMSITPAQARALLKKVSRLRLLVVGDVMLDHYLWGDATRISPEAPVPVVHIHRDDDYKAGGAANVALNITALGAGAEICGAIGDDPNGNRLLEILRRQKVEFDDRFRAKTPTITKTRVVVRNQQLCRLDKEESWKAYAAEAVKARGLLKERAAAADAVILSDYAKGYLSTAIVKDLRDVAHHAGKLVAWDPKPRGRIQATDLDLVTPNRHEAVELSGLNLGEDDREVEAEVCRQIWQRYHPRNLVITLGADGMLLSREGRVEKQIPTAAREVYDVSGAGDTVIASLTLALAAGADLETAAHFANAAAGVVVGKLGTATVTPEELLAYLGHP
jgi:D-glycero-beta-D-manno-heptose-7-phosphate kinase